MRLLRHASYVDTLAAVAMQLGKCKEAVALQRRAAEDASGSADADVKGRLAGYEERCAAATR